MPNLNEYGWDPGLEEVFSLYYQGGLVPGRVVLEERGVLDVATESGTWRAALSGRLRHHAAGSGELPAIGDWVALELSDLDGVARIRAVLPRRSKISRKVAGALAVEQLLAANVDVVLLVMGLDGDFNVRRLERLLVLAWESGARPVVVLNKLDLCPDPGDSVLQVEEVAPGVPVVTTTALGGEVEELSPLLVPGETVVLLGSSGVGKSTLLNRLYGGDLLRTASVRSSDDRGRHTTTHRRLVQLPGGCLLIDSPGLREIQLWDSDEGLEAVFEDIRELATGCRFRDCTHQDEPSCAVRASVESGELDTMRLESLRKLESETASLERRRDVRARRQVDKRLGRLYRAVMKEKQSSRKGG